jgi:hypothetical protein
LEAMSGSLPAFMGHMEPMPNVVHGYMTFEATR